MKPMSRQATMKFINTDQDCENNTVENLTKNENSNSEISTKGTWDSINNVGQTKRHELYF